MLRAREFIVSNVVSIVVSNECPSSVHRVSIELLRLCHCALQLAACYRNGYGVETDAGIIHGVTSTGCIPLQPSSLCVETRAWHEQLLGAV